jgi:GTP-binding protein
MFIDKAKVELRAGKGGDGAISFHKEKYVDRGGP